MSNTFLRSLALSAFACVLIGLTACSAETASNPELTSSPIEEAPEPVAIPTLEEAQIDIQWHKGMTIPVPENMNFEIINAEQSCDGALDSTELRSPDASEEATLAYLKQMMDAWGVQEDTARPTIIGDSYQENIRALLSGEVPDKGQFQRENMGSSSPVETSSATNAGAQQITWEALDRGGYRFFLNENSEPGAFSVLPGVSSFDGTPESEWINFPRPNSIPFEGCEMFTQVSYRSDKGMSPPSSTWTLRAVKEVVSFDSALSWFESLKAEGWKDEGGGYEGAAQPGEPGARISNGEFTAQYSESLHPLSIFVSDRISDEFFSED